MADSSTLSITVAYQLNLPLGVQQPSQLEPSRTLGFPVANKSKSDYYTALKDTIKSAKLALGQELTEWRDAVGNAENFKEPKKLSKKDDDGEDEEDDAEGE